MKIKHAPQAIGIFIVIYVGYLSYQYWLFAFRYEQNLRTIPLLLLGLFGASGIFIALRQDWARKVAIGYSIFQIIISIPQLAVVLAHLIQDLKMLPEVFASLGVAIVGLMGHIFLAYLLTRSNIKKEFQAVNTQPTSEKRD